MPFSFLYFFLTPPALHCFYRQIFGPVPSLPFPSAFIRWHLVVLLSCGYFCCHASLWHLLTISNLRFLSPFLISTYLHDSPSLYFSVALSPRHPWSYFLLATFCPHFSLHFSYSNLLPTSRLCFLLPFVFAMYGQNFYSTFFVIISRQTFSSSLLFSTSCNHFPSSQLVSNCRRTQLVAIYRPHFFQTFMVSFLVSIFVALCLCQLPSPPLFSVSCGHLPSPVNVSIFRYHFYSSFSFAISGHRFPPIFLVVFSRHFSKPLPGPSLNALCWSLHLFSISFIAAFCPSVDSFVSFIFSRSFVSSSLSFLSRIVQSFSLLACFCITVLELFNPHCLCVPRCLLSSFREVFYIHMSFCTAPSIFLAFPRLVIVTIFWHSLEISSGQVFFHLVWAFYFNCSLHLYLYPRTISSKIYRTYLTTHYFKPTLISSENRNIAVLYLLF